MNYSQEEILKINQQNRIENEIVYKDFIENLEKGICFLCGNKISSFQENNFCLHWFTKPNNIKKKDFEKPLKEKIGFFKIDSYFRWLANSEILIKNINDLETNKSKTSFIETSYKYKNIEWSLSVGNTDLEGHKNSKNADFPHFHIQMKSNNLPFLNFNDYHIPFSDDDLHVITMLKEKKAIKKDSFGVGLGVIEDQNIEKMISRAENYESAQFNLQTKIVFPSNIQIDQDFLNKIVQESRDKNIPTSELIKHYIPEAIVTKEIQPTLDAQKLIKRSGKK